DKRAARRNRLKRRIREVFRLSRQFFAEHADVVVIARQGATELPYRSMQRELRHLLIRAGIISADNRGPERGARNRQRRPR
ncbi:MAG: ribonuclease P protein component, partial [Bdellovibrionales bacterium]|nr:ribonuclease P protein component [Bdellovibrionales bacterium]